MGSLPSPIFNPNSSYVVPLFWSIQSGGSTAAPSSGSFTDGWRNTTVSAATAQANVTIARLTPRTRSAGTAITMPATSATSVPTRIGQGNGQPRSVDSVETVNAEKPANVICASEICPTKPVRTTIDRQMTIPISELARAPRNAGVNQNIPATAAKAASAGPP